MAGSRRKDYKRPTKRWNPLDVNEWLTGVVTMKKGGLKVVSFVPGSGEAIGLCLVSGNFFRRTGGIYEEIEGGIYSAWRRIEHILRRVRAEGAQMEVMALETRVLRNHLIELRARNAQSLWARDVRLGLWRLMDQLGRVKKGSSKDEAKEWLVLVVQPDQPDSIEFRFGVGSDGKVNSGARQAEVTAVARRFNERSVELSQIDAALVRQELAVMSMIEELEATIATILRHIRTLKMLAMANGLVADGERTPHYFLYEIHRLVEYCLRIPPYDRARERLMGEISQIRDLIENEAGEYRLEEIELDEWVQVAVLARTMEMSVVLLEQRGPLERLKLRFAEAAEVGILPEIFLKQLGLIRSNILGVDDSSFDRPVRDDLLQAFVPVLIAFGQEDFAGAGEALGEIFTRRLI